MTQAIIKSVQCEDLVDLFHEAGFRASIEKDATGRRFVIFGSNGYNCHAYVHGEISDQPGSFQKISILFGLKHTTPFTLDVANKWNLTMNSCRSYIGDNGSIRFDYIIVLIGGTTRDNILAAFKLWDHNLGLFINHLKRVSGIFQGQTTPQAEVLVYDKSKLN